MPTIGRTMRGWGKTHPRCWRTRRSLLPGLRNFIRATQAGRASANSCVRIEPDLQTRSEVRRPVLHQAALDFHSSRMMPRIGSSDLGAFPSGYSRSARLMRV